MNKNIDWYGRIHTKKLERDGNAKLCIDCGKKGEKINGKWNIDWSNNSGKYIDLDDFSGRCKPCHNEYDIQKRIGLPDQKRNCPILENQYEGQLTGLRRSIKETRKNKKISQYKLAEMIGTKQSSISRFENGTYFPNLVFLSKIANSLDSEVVIDFKTKILN
ncbi:MAG: helix-turn-helix transcriptional regulator [Patescibacteria group bacterium]|nr:helix-turn-helix transcriptional regulator [Patescibacteria group bacterium]